MTLKMGSRSPKPLPYLKHVTMIYPLKSDEYPSICSRNLNFSNYINFCKLGIDIENGGHCRQNIISSLDCLKGLKCWIGGNQAKGLRDISILVKIYLFKSSSDLENEVKVTKI